MKLQSQLYAALTLLQVESFDMTWTSRKIQTYLEKNKKRWFFWRMYIFYIKEPIIRSLEIFCFSPDRATPMYIPLSPTVISLMLEEKKRSFSSKNWTSPATMIPKTPMYKSCSTVETSWPSWKWWMVHWIISDRQLYILI